MHYNPIIIHRLIANCQEIRRNAWILWVTCPNWLSYTDQQLDRWCVLLRSISQCLCRHCFFHEQRLTYFSIRAHALRICLTSYEILSLSTSRCSFPRLSHSPPSCCAIYCLSFNRRTTCTNHDWPSRSILPSYMSVRPTRLSTPFCHFTLM